ncbi:DUF3135 domain-containing protein [Vibrio alginolyticus]|uniref:DUF3135 domain-containing protein n=1 Tax=Vibrio TaxID=662 RepID=UPI0005ABEE79|nr:MULTISPECIES: DUF3135 domain-containing protein [Vibrio]EMD1211291.1 DUF3135 domain-containing protein [Vibrio alginolyticus]KIP70095.1 hypothetical protein SN12_14890 [Vibrio alginolyticus]KIP83294.1 hypothetical protein SN13_11345 [Vibrio alginolyticus]MCZ2803387.1 DUF3135 domain-containing protein [Vibrio alginolyticus]MDW1974266.1 DUF3135 domain-containing protein [Vibrio sp. Vb1980]
MSTLRHIPSQTLPPFDEMVQMAERDPEAFEQFRHEMAKEMIESASEDMKERLWAQQSHIDRVISTCKNPHHTNVVLMNELRKQVVKFKAALEGEAAPTQKADVVSLNAFKDRDDFY